MKMAMFQDDLDEDDTFSVHISQLPNLDSKKHVDVDENEEGG